MSNYSNTLADLENPISQHYIPAPTPDMDLSTLERWRTALAAQIANWKTILLSANIFERGNILKILAIQTPKLTAYDNAIVTVTAIVQAGQMQENTIATGSSPASQAPRSSGLLALGAFAAGLYFLTRRKKSKNLL